MNDDKIRDLSVSAGELVKKWNKNYREEISRHFQVQIRLLESIRENLSAFRQTAANQEAEGPSSLLLAEIHQLHNGNLEQLRTIFTHPVTKEQTQRFVGDLINGCADDLHSLPDIVRMEFSPDADLETEDQEHRNFRDRMALLSVRLLSFPLNLKNALAGLFRKTEEPSGSKLHTVHFRLIAEGFLLSEYIDHIRACTYNIQKEIVRHARHLFDLETEWIQSDYRIFSGKEDTVPSLQLDALLKEADSFYPGYEKTFTAILERSGTRHAPYHWLRSRAKLNLRQTEKQIQSGYRLWHSTFFAFYEDWRFREELFLVLNGIRQMKLQTLDSYSAKLDKSLAPLISRKKEYLQGLVDRTPHPDESDLPALKHFFNLELYNLQKELNNGSPGKDFHKSGDELGHILQKTELELDDLMTGLSGRTGVVRAPDYEEGILPSEIHFFSPREYMEFECIPPFNKSIDSIARVFQEYFGEVALEFSDFDQITDFALDTAKSMVTNQQSPEQIIIMFREGLDRSLHILDRIAALNKDTSEAKHLELSAAFDGLIERMKSLDDNDNILKIYSRLLKSKALQESREKRTRVVAFMDSNSRRLSGYIWGYIKLLISLYKAVRKKLKIDKAPALVSSEISNFLLEIHKRIYKLPVIYRYLFENIPVREVNLFLHRQAEIDHLNVALKDWHAGNFAATLVIGENGSGKSSLLQHYSRIIKGIYKVSYFSVERFYHREEDFLSLMQDIFENDQLTTDQAILDHLSSFRGHHIVIIDGLERVFLRKPRGFDCLQKLLSFIVSNNNSAFWICGVSLYACNYLDRTVSLKDHFDYAIALHNLSADQINDIVLKRNRLSGFILQYEDTVRTLQGNRRIPDQAELETAYFDELNRYAQSNISLSFYYWLASISEFTDNELYIKRFEAPDFSFLETLNADKIFTLLLVVMHGRLSLEEHSQISNLTMEQSYRSMTLLKEDSILVLKGEYYYLNGILYRHVVQLLNSRNLLH